MMIEIRKSKSNRFVDLTGQKRGVRKILKLEGFENGHAIWLCKCECGEKMLLSSTAIGKNKFKSCHHGLKIKEHLCEFYSWRKLPKSTKIIFNNSFKYFFRIIGPKIKNQSFCVYTLQWVDRRYNTEIKFSYKSHCLNRAEWGRLFGISRERVRVVINKYGVEDGLGRLWDKYINGQEKS